LIVGHAVYEHRASQLWKRFLNCVGAGRLPSPRGRKAFSSDQACGLKLLIGKAYGVFFGSQK
jgi:hypothetical protein